MQEAEGDGALGFRGIASEGETPCGGDALVRAAAGFFFQTGGEGVGHLDREGIVEVGARNTLSLGEIARELGKKVEFEGAVEVQEILNPEPDFPDVREVLTFMKSREKAGRV